MQRSILIISTVLLILSGCDQFMSQDEYRENKNQEQFHVAISSVNDIESILSKAYEEMDSFYYTKYVNDEMALSVGIDKNQTFMISFENGVAIKRKDEEKPSYHLMNSDKAQDGKLYDQFAEFGNFDGNFDSVSLDDFARDLEDVLNLFKVVDHDQYDYTRFDTKDEKKVNFVTKIKEIVTINQKEYDMRKIQYYYAPDEDTFGIRLEYVVDGVECSENHFLTINGDVEFK